MEEGFLGGCIKEQSDKKDPFDIMEEFDIMKEGFLHDHGKCIKAEEDRVHCRGEFDIMNEEFDTMEGFLHDHEKCIKAEGLEIEADTPKMPLSPIKFPDWKWDDKFWPRFKRGITSLLFESPPN